MALRMHVIELKMLWKDTEAKVDEPFEETVKQIQVKPLDDISAEDKNEMNVDVIGYQLLIYNDVKMTMRIRLTKSLMKLSRKIEIQIITTKKAHD